jgi:hypothetical protein
MKKPLYIVLSFFMFSSVLLAQDTVKSWKNGGSFGLNVSQVGLTNWAGGGENSLSMAGLINLFANYKKDKVSWDNALELGYGLVKQGKTELRKSDDKIVLTSKFGRAAIDFWSYSAFLNYRSQFAKGYDYGKTPKLFISEFMAPAYVTLALGAEYKPHENFFVLISPITGKSTIVLNKDLRNAGAFGVEKGSKFNNEFGWSVNSQYKKKLMENIDFQSKLSLFSSYEELSTVDVNWENLLVMKVNKYISTSISTQLLYDKDIKAADGKSKIQFKEVIAAGLLYQF